MSLEEEDSVVPRGRENEQNMIQSDLTTPEIESEEELMENGGLDEEDGLENTEIFNEIVNDVIPKFLSNVKDEMRKTIMHSHFPSILNIVQAAATSGFS